MGQTSAALAAALINLMPAQSGELLDEVLQIDEPQRLSYLLAARLLQRSNLAERQQLLEVVNTRTRLDLMQALLRREYQLLEHARYVEGPESVPPEALERIPPPDRPETPLRLAGLPPRPGRAVGLAWNNGRAMLATIEALALTGHGNMTLTGRVATIHDQALVARSWVHANAALLGLSNANLSRIDLHLHVRGDLPDIPTPALGLAVIAALVSCLSGRIVLDGTLLNGELTLLGELLPADDLDALALAAAECGAGMLIHGPALPHPHPHNSPRRLSFIQVEDALAAALSSPLEHDMSLA
jgi:ATP-dependent Lon protease